MNNPDKCSSNYFTQYFKSISRLIHSFSITGTAEWGLHFPEANGDYQSPINLASREAQFDDTLNNRMFSVNYVPCRESEMINTGNTVQISLRYKPGKRVYHLFL